MLRNICSSFILLTLLGVVGCQGLNNQPDFGHPDQKYAKEAYYGEYPEDYKQTIKKYAKSNIDFFDPQSIRFRWSGGEPQKAYVHEQLAAVKMMMVGVNKDNIPDYISSANKKEDSFIFGYGEVVMINAKNRFGAYSGYKPFFFLLGRDNNDDKSSVIYYDNREQINDVGVNFKSGAVGFVPDKIFEKEYDKNQASQRK